MDIFPRDFGSPIVLLIFKLLRARPVLGAFCFVLLIFKLLRARPVLGAFFFGELIFKLLRARPVLVFVLFILW